MRGKSRGRGRGSDRADGVRDVLAHDFQFFVQSTEYGLSDSLFNSVEHVGRRGRGVSVGVEGILESIADCVGYQGRLSGNVFALEEQGNRLDDIRDRFAGSLVRSNQEEYAYELWDGDILRRGKYCLPTR